MTLYMFFDFLSSETYTTGLHLVISPQIGVFRFTSLFYILIISVEINRYKEDLLVQRYCTGSIPLFTTATVLVYVVVSWPLNKGIIQTAYHCLPQLQSWPLDKGIVQAAYHCFPQLQSWYMWLCLGL